MLVIQDVYLFGKSSGMPTMMDSMDGGQRFRLKNNDDKSCIKKIESKYVHRIGKLKDIFNFPWGRVRLENAY